MTDAAKNNSANTYSEVLKIDETKDTPIYKQLRDGLRNLLITKKNGDKLPAERQLCKSLNINRQTYRKALEEFIEKGIVRRTTKGTVIVRNEDTINAEIHPFALGAPFIFGTQQDLKFVIYENLPKQKMVWSKIVDMFNETDAVPKVSIEWLSLDVNSPRLYQNFIREQKPDLYLLYHFMVAEFRNRGLLAPLSEDLKRKLTTSDKYLKIWSEEFDDTFYSWAVPMSFSSWIMVWNKELLNKAGYSDIPELRNRIELFGFLNEVSSKLDEDCCAMTTAWAALISYGIPKHTDADRDTARKFLEESFGLLQQYALNKKMFNTRTEANGLFSFGKSLMVINSPTWAFQYYNKPDFEWGARWVIPEAGLYISSAFSCLGINHSCTRRNEVESFIDFVCSKPAQDVMTSNLLCCSMCKAANEQLFAYPATEKQDLMRTIEKVAPAKSMPGEFGYLLVFELRDLYQKVYDGEMGVEEAVTISMRRYYRE